MTAQKPTVRFLSYGSIGLFSGIGVGSLFAYLESLGLLIQVGHVFVDWQFLVKAVLIYGATGGFSGLSVSFLFYHLLFKRKDWAKEKSAAFTFSSFLGAGLFIELFVYLMDILPFGGPNKWSGKTLSLVAAAGAFSCLVIVAANRLLRSLAASSISGKFKHRRVVSLFVFPGLCFLFFVLIFQIKTASEQKVVAGKHRAGKANSPNVMMILVDALRPDHLSCYGYPLATSPHLDALAAQGGLYRSVFAASNWTLPTHASLFSGLYPSSHGVVSTYSVAGNEYPTLAEILSKNGYYTIALNNHPWLDKSLGLVRGFDVVLALDIYKKTSLTLARIYRRFIKRESPTDEIVKLTRRWVDHCHKRKVPSFVFMNLLDLHEPYRRQEPYFSDSIKSLPMDRVNLPLVRRFEHPMGSKTEQLELLAGFGELDFLYLSRLYDSNLRYVDEKIGQLLRGLEEKNQLSQTFLAITSDHGEYLGEMGVGHGNPRYPSLAPLYDPVLKIPLIFWCPGRIEPHAEERNISQVDILPTILSLLDLRDQIPEEIQGVDVSSFQEPRDILAECWDDAKNSFSRMIVFQKVKLIANADGQLELYDLESDPEEKLNLSASRPDLAGHLHEKLEKLAGSFKRFPSRVNEKKKKGLEELLKSLGYLGPR